MTRAPWLVPVIWNVKVYLVAVVAVAIYQGDGAHVANCAALKCVIVQAADQYAVGVYLIVVRLVIIACFRLAQGELYGIAFKFGQLFW